MKKLTKTPKSKHQSLLTEDYQPFAYRRTDLHKKMITNDELHFSGAFSLHVVEKGQFNSLSE